MIDMTTLTEDDLNVMTANDYQKAANRTCIDEPERVYTPHELMIVWNSLKLAGEAGEIADLVGKGVFHDTGLDVPKIVKEMGDVLWYLAALCKHLNVPMEQVMAENIAKLKARYPDGWDTSRSHKPGETPIEERGAS